MKKLLKIIPAVLLISSPLASVVACGSGDDKTITYGTVDNGKDNISLPTYKKMEEIYYSLYGNEYKLKGINEIGDNEGPEKILSVGPQAGPDIYNASVDMTARLANANAIIALEGPDAPTGENGAGKILTDLNYNVEHSEEVLARFESNDPENDEVTDLEEWTTWLPSAVNASKFVNRNPQSQAKGEAYQYGITRSFGVGGGSAITRIDKEDSLERAGWVDENEDGTADNPVSFNDLINASSGKSKIDSEEDYEPNSNLSIMLERGMWEMYPIYSNVISNELSDGKVYKAAEIGVNWVNPGESDPLYDKTVPVGKYSSIFTHPEFVDSTKEVLGKWFDLWSQAMKVAIKNLEGQSDKDNPINLLDPTNGINATVKMNLMNQGFISSTTAEPSNYVDWTSAAGTNKEGEKNGFANFSYLNLNSLSLFDKDEELYNKYENQAVNKWLTPSGSNQTVFSKNLAGKPEKLKAAIRWVELLYGFVENETGEVVPYEEMYGGMYNLNDMYASGSSIPAKLAIENKKWQEDEEFNNLLAKKIDNKVAKAIDKDPNYQTVYNKNKDNEDNAIVRLEKFNVDLAANLYGSDNTLTVAPQVTAYDPATNNDHHGVLAMKPALTKAYFKDGKARPDFEEIYGKYNEPIDLNSEKYTNVKNEFIKDFLTSMATLNNDMNK